jgi:hypothetical protein
MHTSPRHTALGLILLLMTAGIQANIYEFTLAGGEEACFFEFFTKGNQPSLNFQAYRLTKDNQNEELSDLTKAGVIEKRKGTVKVNLRVESQSGIVYTAISKSDQKKTFKAKETEKVNMCFKNQETVVAFVIFDFRTGIYAADLTNIPTGNDTQAFMEKLEGIRLRLDNSLSLYRQMEAYEEKHLNSSTTVLSGVLLVSQIMIAVIALVGWGITVLLEKSLKYKKIV